jgi:hypothetical protein
VGGAMAMGFYFKTPAQHKSFVTRHKKAISYFSYVTLAYQVFFVAWLAAVVGISWLPAGVLVLVGLIFFLRANINTWAIVIYAVSAMLFFVFWRYEWPAFNLNAKEYWPHAVLPLAIGFILSPYLDITFHRAYRLSDKPKLSFSIGFGLLFLSLIGFVFLYTSSLGEVFFAQGATSVLIYPLIIFLVLQISFTIAAHCSELREQGFLEAPTLLGLVAGLSILLTVLLLFTKNAGIPWLNIPFAETLYKAFLFFYSLVFPLYLLFSKSKLTFLGLLALCTPMYASGFLLSLHFSYLLSIGAVVILTAIIITKQPKPGLN